MAENFPTWPPLDEIRSAPLGDTWRSVHGRYTVEKHSEITAVCRYDDGRVASASLGELDVKKAAMEHLIRRPGRYPMHWSMPKAGDRGDWVIKTEVPPLKAPEPAKPVLLVPDGCVLVIPDDVQPWEFLARYDTTQMGKTALVVNRSGYETMQKVDAAIDTAIKTEAAETKRTHAALTFEQPIQSRLGRMAK